MNRTELVFIIDRSGSMQPLKSDVVGSFNALLEEQKKNEDVLVSVVFFSDKAQLIKDREPIEKIGLLQESDYQPSGCTALLDTLGDAIVHIEQVQHYIRKEDRPEKTIFAVITDGMENASHRYNGEKIRKLLDKKNEDGWQFLYLASNIDTYATARDYGFKEELSCSYKSTSKGYRSLMKGVNSAINSLREESCLASNWRDEIEND